MRILYDTNILVAVLSRREALLRFKSQVAAKQFTNITSKHVLAEVEAVLIEKFCLARQRAKAAVRLLQRQSIVVHPANVKTICRDPFDDHILAAAVAGEAEYLVTEDEDLLILEQYKGVKIVTYSAFNQLTGV